MAVKIEWKDASGKIGISCIASDTKPDAPAGSVCWETDTGTRYERDGDTWRSNGTNGAAHVSHSTHLPGARNETSTTTDYLRALPVCTVGRQDIGTTETLVTANPAVLLGIVANSGQTGTVSLRDASAISGGSTPVLVVAMDAGGTAGAQSEVNCFGAHFANGITVQGGNVACDVTLFWLPL